MKVALSTPKAEDVGPLLACGIADAYGAGFEFAGSMHTNQFNHMKGYVTHPAFKERPTNAYTDDCQMALGLAEFMLGGSAWTPKALADQWVDCFHRDPRTGYAKSFYEFLQNTHSGLGFLQKIQPHSVKNGAAMRAFPLGYLSDPLVVRNKAFFQASLTHATYEGSLAAAAVALAFHFCYHIKGDQADLRCLLQYHLPGTDWIQSSVVQGKATHGIPTVRRALKLLVEGTSLESLIQDSVALGGDTDTVAAIVAPLATVCPWIENDIPAVLIDTLENGRYGRDHLNTIGQGLAEKYPSQSADSIEASTLEAPIDPNEGPIDFLFSHD